MRPRRQHREARARGADAPDRAECGRRRCSDRRTSPRIEGPHFGYDAESGEFTDLIKAGVVDPAKVTRLALQNAASIAALMLTTEALMAEIKEDDKKAMGAGAGGPGGGMGGMY